ncbi:hypothetical protein RSJ42_04720 [Methanosarcina hadiensis]|uniref:hypothetical protein n=1 Tax=Methanosarcina hadiensis TaxID=3078083 RepID=UPI003977CA5E
MKIKSLSFILLLLIITVTGVLATSGCIDPQAQPVMNKHQGDLYRNIFYPYAGLFKGDNMPGPEGPHPGMPEGHYPPGSLQDTELMLGENIVKAEAISARLETGIQYLKEQGKDIGKLESLLEEYNGLVEEAKYYLGLATSASEENTAGTNNGSDSGLKVESTEKEYLMKSQKSMIRASLVLKDIFEEFKLLMPGNEELNETDRLSAEGEGKVTLFGSFDLNLHLEEGEIAVMSPDSIVKIEGDYTFESKEGRPDNIIVYYIQSADLEVSGSRKILLLSGKNITVEADGKGYATFLGNGNYTVEYTVEDAGGMKKEEQWASESFFNEGMGPEKTENKIPQVGVHGPEARIRENLLKGADSIEKSHHN